MGRLVVARGADDEAPFLVPHELMRDAGEEGFAPFARGADMRLGGGDCDRMARACAMDPPSRADADAPPDPRGACLRAWPGGPAKRPLAARFPGVPGEAGLAAPAISRLRRQRRRRSMRGGRSPAPPPR